MNQNFDSIDIIKRLHRESSKLEKEIYSAAQREQRRLKIEQTDLFYSKLAQELGFDHQNSISINRLQLIWGEIHKSPLKQNLQKSDSHEQRIIMLRKHLQTYSKGVFKTFSAQDLEKILNKALNVDENNTKI